MTHPSAAAAKVTTAAATVPGLECLTLDIKGGAQRLSADVLLPLTAAAAGGGAGSSCLKPLKLHAELEAATLVDRLYDGIAARATGTNQLSVDNLKGLALRLQAIFAANHSSSSATPAAARRYSAGTPASGTAAATSSTAASSTGAAGSATAVAAVSHVFLPREPSTHNNENKQLTTAGTAASTSAGPAAVGAGSKWHHALWQLNGLTHLIITHDGTADSWSDLPVQSLPTSLEVLEGNRLNIFNAGSKRFLAVSNLEPANGSVCGQVALHHG